MKKRNTYIILAIFLIILANVIIFINANNNNNNNNSSNNNTNNLVYMGIFEEKIVEEKTYLFTNYRDYYDKFNSNNLTESDFKNNSYVLITIVFDDCSESNINIADYTIKENNIDVVVTYEASCGLCAPEYMYYLLKVNQTMINPNVNMEYKKTNNPQCNSNVVYKPIIYLYPKETTNVTVKLGYPNLLTTTYPKYENEWNIVAQPNGELTNKSGRTFYGLYWEGINYIKDNFSDGFIVRKDEIAAFLEEKLSILGLNEREANEFIIYWLPKLEESEYNLIRFESIENINNQMPLNITPTPDTIIRVLMEYKPVKNIIDIEEQKLTTPIRNGFTVVEWGGSLIE